MTRFWNNNSIRVQERYWDSLFLGHTTSFNLVERIKDGVTGLDLSKQVQLLMNGSTLNWKVLSDTKKDREEIGLSKLIRGD